MNRVRILIYAIAFLLASFTPAPAAESGKILLVPLKGAVNPPMAEMAVQSIGRAEAIRASAVVLLIDTPGGLLTSTREIVQAILKSPVPVIAYVSPSGAQCASAGTFIALACPVLALAPGTNIGAAHPVTPMGKMDQVMEEKVVNDAVSYITSLAAYRGRDQKWAEDSVRKSVSVNAEQAVSLHVADLVAGDLPKLLGQIDGRVIVSGGRTVTLNTRGAEIEEVKLNLRYQILQAVSDPTIVYILLLLGILGLLAEFSHPGTALPGTVGVICLLLAFYGLSTLPFNIAGVALIFLAAGFFIMETHTHSFGLLGMGGIVSLMLGSLFLIKSYSFIQTSKPVVLASGAIFALLVLLIASLAFRAQRSKVTTGREGLIGEVGKARTDLNPEGTVHVHGEYWTARSVEGAIKQGESFRVTGISGTILLVQRIDPNAVSESPAKNG